MTTFALTPTLPALEPFVAAGILTAADIALLTQLLDALGTDEPSDDVLIGLALALRAPRLGHVCVSLPTIAGEVVPDESADAVPLAWPELTRWRAALAASPLVASPDDTHTPPRRPFVLDGDRLYITRLWHDEVLVADRLRSMAADGERLTVITGGPGTGKTTRIARELLALLEALPADQEFRIALSASTGKAAARMKDVLSAALARSAPSAAALARVSAITSATLHKLLGVNPGRLDQRYSYHATHRLPFDLIIVDEVSMVSLPMLARLLDAVGDTTRLMLVGDADQLASVEVGCVLADLVGAGSVIAPRLTSLTTSYRFGADSGVGQLAAAIRAGDAAGVMDVLHRGLPDVEWLDSDADGFRARLQQLQRAAATAAAATATLAAEGRSVEALRDLERSRTLCAHRTGDWGVTSWNQRIEGLMSVDRRELWYVGRPVMVTHNDHSLGVSNGDLGIVVRDESRVRVAFPDSDSSVRLIPPARLDAVETAHVMTIHKSQGSEFAEVTVVLPPLGSRLLTRELLYTGVTRAQKRVVVVGTEEAIRASVGRRAARASGLGERLG